MAIETDGISQRPDIVEHLAAIQKLQELAKYQDIVSYHDALNYAVGFLQSSTDDLR